MFRAGGILDSPGLTVYDQLWCKAALAFLRQLVAECDEANSEVCLSMGPVLSKTPTCFLAALSSLVDPEPACHQPVPAAGDTFNIEEEGPLLEDIDTASIVTARKLDQRLLFFSVVKSNPSNVVLLSTAPKVWESKHLMLHVWVGPPHMRSRLVLQLVSGWS
jgi:hypothetical protein